MIRFRRILFLPEGGIEMSGLYQIPGLFLTVLCHAIVIYHMAEHRYSKKRFVLYSCIYIICFVSIGGYGYATGGYPEFYHIRELL